MNDASDTPSIDWIHQGKLSNSIAQALIILMLLLRAIYSLFGQPVYSLMTSQLFALKMWHQ